MSLSARLLPQCRGRSLRQAHGGEDLVGRDRQVAYGALKGHRVFAAGTTEVALYELEVMRRAVELLPIRRRLEREVFGVSPT